MKENAPLKVYDLTEQHKNFLYSYAEKELGSRSRTKAILHLINEKMTAADHNLALNNSKQGEFKTLKNGKKRIQISLRENDYIKLVAICDNTDTSPINYIIRVILSSIYSENIRLLGSEIEQFKKSNYELHKIGVNINQIAKAINSGENLNFDFDVLNSEISSHLDIVKKVLKSSLEKY